MFTFFVKLSSCSLCYLLTRVQCQSNRYCDIYIIYVDDDVRYHKLNSGTLDDYPVDNSSIGECFTIM